MRGKVGNRALYPRGVPVFHFYYYYYNTDEIRELLDEAVDNITRNVHKDVQNLHLELFRQFQIQLSDMKGLLDEYTDKIKGLVEENDRLRKENILLRNVY